MNFILLCMSFILLCNQFINMMYQTEMSRHVRKRAFGPLRFGRMRPAKIQISLRVREIWSVFFVHEETLLLWVSKMCSAKSQIRLRECSWNMYALRRFRSVWLELLGAFWTAKDAKFFMRTTKTLIRLRGCAGWSESSLCADIRMHVANGFFVRIMKTLIRMRMSEGRFLTLWLISW